MYHTTQPRGTAALVETSEREEEKGTSKKTGGNRRKMKETYTSVGTVEMFEVPLKVKQ